MKFNIWALVLAFQSAVILVSIYSMYLVCKHSCESSPMRCFSEIRLLLVISLLAVAWACGYSLELSASTLEWKKIWATVQYPFILLIPVAWFVFARRLIDESAFRSIRQIAVLCILPIFTQPIIWTNNAHHQFWSDFQLLNDGSFLLSKIEYGPAFWVANFYSILLVVIGSGYLIRKTIVESDYSHARRRLFVIAAFLPLISNVLYTQRWGLIPNLDLTPFAFGVSGVLMIFDFVSQRLDSVIDQTLDQRIRKAPETGSAAPQTNQIVNAFLAIRNRYR